MVDHELSTRTWRKIRILVQEVDPDDHDRVIADIVGCVLDAPLAAALLVETGVDLDEGAHP